MEMAHVPDLIELLAMVYASNATQNCTPGSKFFVFAFPQYITQSCEEQSTLQGFADCDPVIPTRKLNANKAIANTKK